MKLPFYRCPTLILLFVVLLAAPLVALAAGPAVPPGAGSILQQIQPPVPAVPASGDTGLSVEPVGGVKLPKSLPFLVKTLRIIGNSRIDTTTLHALVANEEGKTLTLAQLGGLAGRITDYYHSHGYPLAQAIIPAQTISAGEVTIKVIEARYGTIKLDNSSRVNDPLLEATLSALQSGQVVERKELDRTLLLLSDIPGVVVNATAKPGEAVGTSDLLVETTPGPAVSANVALDNYGNRYTGRARLSGSMNFNNSLHHGDVLSLSALSSGNHLNYGRLAYDVLLNRLGTRLGGAYSVLEYKLGDSLANLDANGTAQVFSLWMKHPFLRSIKTNLYGQLRYDRLQPRDHIDSTGIQTDRHLENWTLNLTGYFRDTVLSGAVNSWSVGWTSGRGVFDDETAQSVDAATARTEGGFSRWNADFVRLQSLNSKNRVYFAVSGQWANRNLDSSQKMIAGGPYTVRAYDMGAVSGDTGYLGTIELRHDLGEVWRGQWGAVAFIDGAHVTVNKDPWAAGSNSATLSGAGVGLNWTGPKQWGGRAYVATRIGSAPELAENSASTRCWIEVTKSF